jgi:hypothetical protein
MDNTIDVGSLNTPSMEVLKDKQKYFRELLAAKFNRQDLTPIAKHWGKTNKEAMQDFLFISKSYMTAWSCIWNDTFGAWTNMPRHRCNICWNLLLNLKIEVMYRMKS